MRKLKPPADQLNNLFEENRAAIYADASDIENLKRLFKDVDLVIVASSTSKYNKEIATAALESGCDYMDVHFRPKVYERYRTNGN